MAEQCEHFSAIQPVKASVDGCEDCLAIGATWNELRVCLTCGHVGCCEDSQHAHALQHFKATGHPIIASFEATETWGWCYIDRCYFDPMPGEIPKRRTGLKALLGKLGWR